MVIKQATAAALSNDIRALHEAAEGARAHSYAPYSNFRVGAALLTKHGEIVTAGNVENVSYGLTICAERAAIFRAVSEGHTDFEAVAVAGPAATVAPCGACRQVLAEFLSPASLVAFPLDGEVVAVPLGALLPHAFGPDDVLSGS